MAYMKISEITLKLEYKDFIFAGLKRKTRRWQN